MTPIVKPKRKPGRVPGPETAKYTVLLEPELAEWAKVQPGGLSALVRELLRRERDQQDAKPN